MAISVKHAFTSAKADGPDSTLIQPSNWNAEHTITLAAGKVLGRFAGTAGAMQELPMSFEASGQAVTPPTGTTAQRPGTPTAGMMRYNSTLSQLEMYRNGAWGAIGGTASVSATAPTNPQSGDLWYDSSVGQLKTYVSGSWTLSATNTTTTAIVGDGVQTIWTLSSDPGSKNNINVYLGGVYQNKASYLLSGTTLTFTSPPPAGVVGEVIITSATVAGIPNDLSVQTSKIADGNVTQQKIANNAVTIAKINPSAYITSVQTIAGNYTDAALVTPAAVKDYVDAAIPAAVNNVGSTPMYVCRAWINFLGGSAAVRGAGNATVVRNGIGDYTVTFSTPMPDTNYCVVLTCGNSATNSAVVLLDSANAQTVSSVRILAKNAASASAIDPSFVSVAVFR